MRAILTAGLVCVGILLMVDSAAWAQFRDREGGGEDRGREGRGREDRGREGGRDFDPRDIIRQADDNNDGMIDPSEDGAVGTVDRFADGPMGREVRPAWTTIRSMRCAQSVVPSLARSA